VFLRQLQQCEERHHHAEPALARLEQRFEAMECTVLQSRQQFAHALAHAQRVALDRVLGEQLRALEHVVQRQQHLAQVDRRRQLDRRPIRHERTGRRRVAILAGQGVDVLGACLKRSYSCRRRTSSARGSPSSLSSMVEPRQQHARLDLGQDRGHHQVFGGELEAHLVHGLDVVDVLPGDLGDGDVEDVQVLAADQVQQQVQRPFEGVEDDLQRIRRDVEILGDLQHWLAEHDRQRHFLLPRGVLLRGMLEGSMRGLVLRDRVGRAFDCHASVVVEQWPDRPRSIAGARACGRGRGLTWITFVVDHVGCDVAKSRPAPVRPCPNATCVASRDEQRSRCLEGPRGSVAGSGSIRPE
jgi:hypothetical protein